ncbi:scyllo-inositol 2-dehydrogenase (NADP+) [Microbacteriaceae bacterium SG_E_30_P1]|uniref:Scyllo-inositol 2-dehydrogenase (NADP+) n=1 Tax=Antiquaquibacter oligotrophicus TaxID=2880260 RepID=A0ABT6KM85_9MICO|nr:Gfo/Idh/MocA family oxidoreductase [Antiquaquibacter oligotrophicus]MDH6181124.1 scyllo-inositol 2-dehydrogenase (NADP+) [Antiquaquibacter oligotrophicus]UDF13179.1 Gfo/Idh/MocA family oxidoreductase [Antiquaquibacter oligotrophicus]
MPSNRPIRTGIIGFGLSGRVFHGPFLATNPDFRVDVIATGNPERAADAARLHPDAVVVGSPDELLARLDDLDLVVLASPPHTHLEQGLAALDGGAAVVIDKPFVPTVVEARKLIAKSEEVGQPLAVFHNRRWDADFLTVRRLIDEGALGRVHRFESTFERWGKPVADKWQDNIPSGRGGGITYDLGSHLVDQALQLFGPAEVEHAELTIVREGGTSEDDATISLLHTSGVRSHLTMSRVAAQSGPRFRVLGTESGFRSYGLDTQEPVLKEGMLPDAPAYGTTPEADWGLLGIDGAGSLTPVPMERGDYPAFYAGVAASILDGAPAPVDPREALEVVRILERAHALAHASSR